MRQPTYPPPEPAHPSRWGRFATWTGAAAVAAFAIGGGLGVWLNDDTTTANPSSCKSALEENFRAATGAVAADRDSSPCPRRRSASAWTG
ncbi:hypothetical protein KEF29_03225 [Streptomyces tuirus]|uniref:Uncharacterized protein n=1 Tax=Streptomyces tuirus TaxID=68278 RepID=A0A941FC22_9ACTN|nr:hypothetical protein [Streptomyces tuirus]